MARNIKNTAASVHQRLLNKAKESSRPFNELLPQHLECSRTVALIDAIRPSPDQSNREWFLSETRFGPPVLVCINKYDLNADKTAAIESFSMERKVAAMGRIPFDTGFTHAMIQEKTIVEYDGRSPGFRAVEDLWKSLFAEAVIALVFRKVVESGRSRLGQQRQASALDLDDGHRAAGRHHRAEIFLAVLAVDQETGSSGRETLAHMILDYEVAVRMAAGRDFSALDALFQIIAENGLSGEDIEAMEVHTFERALRLNNYPDPESLESAQFSISFCLAAAAKEGQEALLPMDPDMLGRKDIAGLARKVSLHVDPALDILFPAQTPARLAVETVRGRFEASCHTPLGDPGNPMDDLKLEEKFTRLSDRFLNAQEQREVLSAIDRVDRDGPLPLFSILGRKPSGLCNRFSGEKFL